MNAILVRVVREGLYEVMEYNTGGSEESSVPGRGDSKCKVQCGGASKRRKCEGIHLKGTCNSNSHTLLLNIY